MKNNAYKIIDGPNESEVGQVIKTEPGKNDVVIKREDDGKYSAVSGGDSALYMFRSKTADYDEAERLTRHRCWISKSGPAAGGRILLTQEQEPQPRKLEEGMQVISRTTGAAWTVVIVDEEESRVRLRRDGQEHWIGLFDLNRLFGAKSCA